MSKNEIKQEKKALFWFRNDLRLEDNVGLFHALSENDSVACVFFFDKDFLNSLKKNDMSFEFLYKAVSSLKQKLRKLGSDLIVRYGNPTLELPELAKKYEVKTIYTNKIYLHEEILREELIEQSLYAKDISFKSYKDNVIFSPEDIVGSNGEPFESFTEYKDVWNSAIKTEDLKTYVISNNQDKLAKFSTNNLPKIDQFGFIKSKLSDKINVSPEGANEMFEKFKPKLKKYFITRDIPHYSGVSYMSIYIRFGLISIRSLLKGVSNEIKTYQSNEDKENAKFWIEQWIRREYFIQYYYFNPKLFVYPYKKHYMSMKWENNMVLFDAWCKGETGYPVIDAAMRNLNATGYMHQRLRQLTASFLTKVLCIDYKYGEAYFASMLLDYDKVANNLGWQWAASVNNESSEYIKMYSPVENGKKFDFAGQYIKKQINEFAKVPSKYIHEPWLYENELKEYGVVLGENYPYPIVNYDERKWIVLKKYEEVNKL